MKFSEGMATVEAVLFASGEPIEADKLAAAAEIEKETVIKLIDRLNDRYSEQGSSLVVKRLGESYQMMTRPEFARNIKSALENRRQAPLSQAALEVLAIVAYNQPVTRGFVEQVRGVDSSGVVKSLTERNLLEEYGRLEDVPGRPIAYKTTENFLRCFGLNSLDALPPIPNSTDQIDFDEYDEMQESGEVRGSTEDTAANE